MTLATISPPTYVLDERNVANWSAAQERGIPTTYPFELPAEEPGDYVVRTYLQFLWLPESIMSLNYLIPSLQRVNAPSGSSNSMPHPMHGILEPLLLTTPSVNKKYRSELARILSNGGGEGEMEEAMMWYAVEHEKPLDDAGGNSPQKHGRDGDEGPWTNAEWREQYMERMEGREVQIQILLYLLKFSLPGPQPPLAESNNIESTSKFKKRKRSAISSPPEPILTAEDHLESFMDKLAMWQLVERVDGALNSTNTGQTKIDENKKNQDDRDWTQIFAEDVVEPQFKSKLPEACKLLRSKVFPTPPFSDTESDTPTTRKASPEPIMSTSPTTSYVPTGVPLKKSLSRVPSTSISRAPSASLRAHSLSRHLPSPTHPKSSSTFGPSRTFVRSRSRSRSLSLSLAKEQEERAAAAANAVEQHTKKRLNREVSMSRVFKSKGKGKRRGISNAEGRKKGEVAAGETVKIEATKAEKRHKEDKGVTLVEETPIKARVSFGTVNSQRVPIAPLNFGTTGVQMKGSHVVVDGINNDEEEEEEWTMDSSPAIIVFDP